MYVAFSAFEGPHGLAARDVPDLKGIPRRIARSQVFLIGTEGDPNDSAGRPVRVRSVTPVWHQRARRYCR